MIYFFFSVLLFCFLTCGVGSGLVHYFHWIYNDLNVFWDVATVEIRDNNATTKVLSWIAPLDSWLFIIIIVSVAGFYYLRRGSIQAVRENFFIVFFLMYIFLYVILFSLFFGSLACRVHFPSSICLSLFFSLYFLLCTYGRRIAYERRRLRVAEKKQSLPFILILTFSFIPIFIEIHWYTYRSIDLNKLRYTYICIYEYMFASMYVWIIKYLLTDIDNIVYGWTLLMNLISIMKLLSLLYHMRHSKKEINR